MECRVGGLGHLQIAPPCQSTSPRIVSSVVGGRQRVISGLVSVAASVCVCLSSFQGCALAAAAIPDLSYFPWEQASQEQDEPKEGTCSTCIGAVDETLGSCNATTNCVSSFDDRFEIPVCNQFGVLESSP